MGSREHRTRLRTTAPRATTAARNDGFVLPRRVGYLQSLWRGIRSGQGPPQTARRQAGAGGMSLALDAAVAVLGRVERAAASQIQGSDRRDSQPARVDARGSSSEERDSTQASSPSSPTCSKGSPSTSNRRPRVWSTESQTRTPGTSPSRAVATRHRKSTPLNVGRRTQLLALGPPTLGRPESLFGSEERFWPKCATMSHTATRRPPEDPR